MTAAKLVTWAYADWRLQTTTAKQIERLKQHMQEVSGFVLESQAKGRGLKLADNYLPSLQEQLDKLERKTAMAGRAGRFGVSSFVRGTGS